uniref:DNA polymerase n=1 Tax=Lentinus flexipes TaxID=3163629 RepID=UPI002263FA3B|nr:DNA polymerase [Ganoderma flexipes]UYX56921.1 DNA polymerase [Ganoderma flexipes]
MSVALRKFLKDHGRGYSTMAHNQLPSTVNNLNKNQLIVPLTRKAIKPSVFFTMDIETITYKGHQLPCLISVKVTSQVKVFRIRKVDMESVFLMWVEYLEDKTEAKVNTILSHNLGGFDGIFLSKFVNSYFSPEQVETVVDVYRKHISLLILKNIFLILQKSKIMEKLLYFIKIKKYIFLFYKDSLALYKALKAAQSFYIEKYGVDITSIVSLPSLAMKIFRLNFLEHPIPILTGFNDYFVRKAYFGGAVDIYKAHAKKCYYYDVVSLYPYAMCKPMPLELLETLTGDQLNSFDLDNFFGFIDLEIECPKSVSRPVLPFRWQNRTIYPKGKFSGVYFSEEIKDMLNYGYKIQRIKCAKRFSKGYIFNDYVKEMFGLKKNSTGPLRWIAKLLLNSLY